MGCRGGLWAPSALKPPHCGMASPSGEEEEERGIGRQDWGNSKMLFFFNQKMEQISPAHPISRFKEGPSCMA